MRPGGLQSRYGGTNGVGAEETTTAQQPRRSLRRWIGPPEGAEGGLEEMGTPDPSAATCDPAPPTACGSDATVRDDRLWTG